ncbi:hypothetical protein C3L33_05498, partial [Rhododendron williamsianum]
MFYGLLDHVRSAKWGPFDGNRLCLSQSITNYAADVCTVIRAGPHGGCCVAHGNVVHVYDWMLEEHPPVNLDYQKVNDVGWIDEGTFVVSGGGRMGLFRASTGEFRHRFQVTCWDQLKGYTAGALCSTSDKIFSGCRSGSNENVKKTVLNWSDSFWYPDDSMKTWVRDVIAMKEVDSICAVNQYEEFGFLDLRSPREVRISVFCGPDWELLISRLQRLDEVPFSDISLVTVEDEIADDAFRGLGKSELLCAVTGKLIDCYEEAPGSLLDRSLGNADRLQWLHGTNCLMVASLTKNEEDHSSISLWDVRFGKPVWLRYPDDSWIQYSDSSMKTWVRDVIAMEEVNSICAVNQYDEFGFLDLRNPMEVRSVTGSRTFGFMSDKSEAKLVLHDNQLFLLTTGTYSSRISVFCGPDWELTSTLRLPDGQRSICDISLGGDRLFILHKGRNEFDIWETPRPPII